MWRALREDVQILRCPICSASEIDCSHSRAHGHLCACVMHNRDLRMKTSSSCKAVDEENLYVLLSCDNRTLIALSVLLISSGII
jgi:hypothetical protein